MKDICYIDGKTSRGRTYVRVPLLDKFQRYVSPEPNSGCWLWLGWVNEKGYGGISLPGGGKTLKAHRASYELFNGPIGDKIVLHGCDNPSCVNPAHLSLGSNADNTREMVDRGRARSREKLARGLFKSVGERIKYPPVRRSKAVAPKERAPRKPRKTISLRDRFFRYVSAEPMSGCWLWAGDMLASGYGRIWDGLTKKTLRAHRVSYELHKGPIPYGMLVLHECDNPACVNPSHLVLGTSRDNTQDMLRKGRGGYETRRGLDNSWTKLTPKAVAHIKLREMNGPRYANLYGVGPSAIYAIWSGKTWREVQA